MDRKNYKGPNLFVLLPKRENAGGDKSTIISEPAADNSGAGINTCTVNDHRGSCFFSLGISIFYSRYCVFFRAIFSFFTNVHTAVNDHPLSSHMRGDPRGGHLSVHVSSILHSGDPEASITNDRG